MKLIRPIKWTRYVIAAGGVILAIAASGGIHMLPSPRPPAAFEAPKPTAAPVSVFASIAPGWVPSALNNPKVARDGDATVIGNEGSTAGVFFRRDLDDSKKYRLTIVGEPVQHTANLRVRVGDSQPQWYAAPNGTSDLIIAHQSSIEALIYGDTSFAYRLKRIASEDCDACQTDQDRLAEIGAATPGWTPALLGHAEIEHDSSGLIIRGAGGSVGVTFQKTLNPNLTYRLRLSGHPHGGQVLLRLVSGNAEPSYVGAPDGDAEFVISHQSKIEVLVYSESMFKYHLDAITLDICPACPTDDKLRELVVYDVPELTNALTSDRLTAARLILNWVSRITVLGTATDPKVWTNTSRMLGMTAAQIYSDIWAPGSSGTFCGGFAIFLAKVYRLFGIPAFTIDIGYAGSATHVTTVVNINRGGQDRFYIMDPTLNGIFEDTTTGQPIDVEEILRRDREGRYKSYRLHTTTFQRAVFAESEKLPLLHKLDPLASCKISDLQGISKCPNVTYTPEVLRNWTETSINETPVPTDRDLIINLLETRLFGTWGDQPNSELFTAMVKRHGIRVGYPQ